MNGYEQMKVCLDRGATEQNEQSEQGEQSKKSSIMQVLASCDK